MRLMIVALMALGLFGAVAPACLMPVKCPSRAALSQHTGRSIMSSILLSLPPPTKHVQGFPPHGHHFGGNRNNHGQLGLTKAAEQEPKGLCLLPCEGQPICNYDCREMFR
jgi:hypothetical protein